METQTDFQANLQAILKEDKQYQQIKHNTYIERLRKQTNRSTLTMIAILFGFICSIITFIRNPDQIHMIALCLFGVCTVISTTILTLSILRLKKAKQL